MLHRLALKRESDVLAYGLAGPVGHLRLIRELPAP